MRSIFVGLCLLYSAIPSPAAERERNEWIGTWAASPMAVASQSGEPAVGSSTYRNVVRISAGGEALRVQLTNEFGTTQLVVTSAHVGISAGNNSVQPGTSHVITFGGRTSVTIPAGGLMFSDEIHMDAPALSRLAVSVYLADQEVSIRTCHQLASSTNYITQGSSTAADRMKNARTTESWCFVKGIDVKANKKAFSIVTLGDSITDGDASTKDANHRWPDYLAERFHKDSHSAEIGVLNQGIIGNRLLHKEYGPSAISRFDRDVLAQSGVKYLILFMGINDIGWPDHSETVSLDDLVVGITQLVTRAHEHGIRVYGATLTPFGGSEFFSEKGELTRAALNNWYRTGKAVDGVIDFDKTARDPAKPVRLDPTIDSGDHLHPNDAGYRAMANAIDLGLFQ